MSTVLVVGATGVLRPAAASLAERGEHVLALARDRDGLLALRRYGDVTALAVDWSDRAALARVLQESGGADSGLLYCPTAEDTALNLLRSAVTGRVVRLLTSAVAAPGPEQFTLADLPPRADPREVRVVLGWAVVAGTARWHSPEEISEAALRALDEGVDLVLGRLRPWWVRPV